MKLGRLGFTGNNINSRTNSLGVYRPESNYIVQSYNGELDSYRYSGKFLNLSAIGGFQHISCMVMSPAGDKIYLIKNGTSTDVYGYSTGTKTIYQIDLSTPWDISTGTYNNIYLDLPASNFFATTTNRNPQVVGIAFKSDGSKFYILTRKYNTSSIIYSEGKIFQYGTSTPWNISTYTYDSINKSIETIVPVDGRPTGVSNYTLGGTTDLYFSDDGLDMYIMVDGRYPAPSTSSITFNLGTDVDSVYRCSLSSAWDISTLSSTHIELTGSSLTEEIAFSNNFSKLYAITSDCQLNQSTLTTSGSLKDGFVSGSSKSLNLTPYHSFISSSQDYTRGLTFKSNGFVFYFSGDTGYLTQVDLNTSGEIDTASAPSVLDLSSVTSDGRMIQFSSDGMKLYVLSNNPIEIERFNLSIAYDITTATAANSRLVPSPTVAYDSFVFNSDGTRLFLVRRVGTSSFSTISQYNLSVGWDLSTALLQPVIQTNQWQDVISGSSIFIQSVRDIYFRDDGYKLYLLTSFSSFSGTSNSVYQIDLSTPWDITTGTYTVGNKINIANTTAAGGVNASSSDTYKRGITFSSDGTKFYIVEDNTTTNTAQKVVFQYNMSVAWSVNTATLNSGTNPLNTQNNILIWDPNGICFSSDGEYMFLLYYLSSGPGPIVETSKLISGQTRWNITSYAYYEITTIDPIDRVFPIGFKFKTDGTRVYYLYVDGDAYKVWSDDLNPLYPWDFNYYTFSSSYSPPIQLSSITDFYFKSDGTKIYFVDSASKIYVYNLITAWDITTIETTSLNTIAYCRDLYLSPDDTKLFSVDTRIISGVQNNKVYRYNLKSGATSPYDINEYEYSGSSTLGYTSDVTTDLTFGLYFQPDGSKLFTLISDFNDRKFYVYRWSLGTSWDLSTKSNILFDTINLNLNHRINSFKDECLRFSADGSKMFIVSRSTNRIISYPLSISWFPSTNPIKITHYLDIFTDTAGSVFDLTFDTDQQKLYFIDAYQIFQFNLLTGATPGIIANYQYFNKINTRSLFSVPTTVSLTSLAFKSDGSRLYLSAPNSSSPYSELLQVDLNTNWNITTTNLSTLKRVPVFLNSPIFSSSGIFPKSIYFNSDGTKIFIQLNADTVEFPLRTAWDIESIDYDLRIRRETRTRITENLPNSISFNSIKNKLYFAGSSNDSSIYKFDIEHYPSINSNFQTKKLYLGFYSGVTGGSNINQSIIGGISVGKGDGFETLYAATSDNKIYQFEVIKG